MFLISKDLPCAFKKVSNGLLPLTLGRPFTSVSMWGCLSCCFLGRSAGAGCSVQNPFSHRVLVLLILQEVSTLKCQLGDKLWIELDMEPTVDPGRVLEEVWCHGGDQPL